jgi:hypothetical protein
MNLTLVLQESNKIGVFVKIVIFLISLKYYFRTKK